MQIFHTNFRPQQQLHLAHLSDHGQRQADVWQSRLSAENSPRGEQVRQGTRVQQRGLSLRDDPRC